MQQNLAETGIELVQLGDMGNPAKDVGPLSDVAKEVCAATAAMYRSRGFAPPWVGYLALRGSQIVGTCAFTSAPQAGRVEIAYYTFPESEGCGIATAMARSLLAIAQDSAPEVMVVAQTLPVENASTSILKKLGFSFAGVVIHPEDGEVWEWHSFSQRAS